MRHHTTEEPTLIEGMKFYPFEAFGSYYTVEDGTLFCLPMLADGSPSCAEDLGEVTAPESQGFLDTMNAFFDTNFKLETFAGR